jgi:hypothetical protein
MKNYLCPKCRSQIRVGDHIVIAAQGPDNEKGLILLSPEVGDYEKTTHPDFVLKEGVKYVLSCPVCHANLHDSKKENLAKLFLMEDDHEYDFYISTIVGEEVTYKIHEHEVEDFGFHRERYKKYFDLPEEYKKYL